MISVVMAVFNSHRYILKQLNSIINQSVKVDEVVIVDDCSTDDTVQIISHYIEEKELENWRVYKHETNLGFVHTFSDAIKKSNGDIIILCDHDDIWLYNKVETIKNTFDSNNQILALATSFIQIDEDDNIISVKKHKNYSNNNLIRRKILKGTLNKMYFNDILTYNISPGCACAMRGAIRNEFLKTNLALPHDWKINVIGACLDGLYYLDIPTTKYRIYSGNTYGLGHKLDYNKRLKVSKSNLQEKRDILKILKIYCSEVSVVYIQAKKIESLFTKRLELMKTKKFISIGIPTLIKSFQHGTLWESVVYDILSIINYQIRGK